MQAHDRPPDLAVGLARLRVLRRGLRAGGGVVSAWPAAPGMPPGSPTACENCGGEGKIFTSKHGGNDPDVWPVGACEFCEGSGFQYGAPDGAHLLEDTCPDAIGPRVFLAHWVNEPGFGDAPGWMRTGHEGAISPHGAARNWRYLGPVLTPAQHGATIAATVQEETP